MRTDTPKTIYLKDYTPPSYTVKHVDLTFWITPGRTAVKSIVTYSKNHSGNEPLFLNGEGPKLQAITLNGQETDFLVHDDGISLTPPKDAEEFTTEITTVIIPEENTALEGLYKSGDTYCTQCEAQGFRRITFFPDRPDIMATYRVRIEADKDTCPVLLSNGNLIDSGDLPNNRHFTVWDDPTPKAGHLFALVAGNLVSVHDTFTTRSGRTVDLYIYVRKGDEGQCKHAMQSLQKSMKWDEDVYGREYQYNLFNIVAVSDFNMGAMENTSLNIFNTALVLAHPDTATDNDFMRVEGVIAHEYFHNWTGNRVCCRDWFQLTLKEGLTVFRDQEFSADMNSRALKRIEDVQILRKSQFTEDAGPLAHPIRPDNYIEINNFYTVTVYEKGAEVIRMFHTLLGPENYRKATDLYFDRFDGQAVTCEDWVDCMAHVSGLDFSQFKLWYAQAGTPQIDAKTHYNAQDKTFTLTLSQTIPPTPGQPFKQPMHIPVAFGLLSPNGDDLIGTQILHLTKPVQEFVFKDIPSRPVPSILRGFSAPVRLTTDLTNEDLKFLMVHDTDGFNRWEAGQIYALRVITDAIDTGTIHDGFFDCFEGLLDQAITGQADLALLAKALALPDFQVIAQSRSIIDPSAIHDALTILKQEIRKRFNAKLTTLYQQTMETGPYSTTPSAIAKRMIKNTALSYLNDPKIAYAQYEQATNMTDRVAALSVLKDHMGSENKQAFSHFYQTFKDYPLVIDKWFHLQASGMHEDVITVVKKLAQHPDFTLKNPNRVRSLYGAFSANNPVYFHHKSGAGYKFLLDAITELNTKNPQIAARLLTPLRDWKRYTPDRQNLMKSVLEQILALPSLSPDVYEIASKSLKG